MINLPKVLGRVLTAIGDDFIAYLGALVEVAEPRFLDGRDVHEYALAACIGLNKSEPFVGLNHLTVANVVTPCLIFWRCSGSRWMAPRRIKSLHSSRDSM